MNPYYWLGYHLSRIFARLFFGFRILHRERMIQTGPVILAMNHQSYLDPPLAGNACDRAIYFLAKKSLLKAPVLGWLLPKLSVIPVELEKTDRSALKTLIKILRAGDGVLVFPEGSRTPDGNLQPPLPGLGLVIAKTRAPVVPMRIFGAFNAWPIGGRVRLWQRITIVVGEPIYFSDADLETERRDLYTMLSRRVMERIAALQLPSDKIDNHRPSSSPGGSAAAESDVARKNPTALLRE